MKAMAIKPGQRLRAAAARWLPVLLASGWLLLQAAEARAAGADEVFARVGDTVITQKDYEQAFSVASRNKFYHGKPPEGEVARLQREVGDALVTDVLLVKEAQRRRLQPDHAAIQREVDGYEARYRGSEMWEKNKHTMLPPLKKKLAEHSVLDQLKKAVRQVAEPDARQVQAYYEQHKEKFTEPEQVRLSMILLKVDPSSPQAQWNGAIGEGAAIVKRLRAGADFAQLAQLHSGDASAAKGGDMGYLHRGMLPEAAQVAVDKLQQPGSLTEPVLLLEGVAVLRLEDRKAAKLNPLSAVRQRAHDLLVRDLSDQAWATLVDRLKRETPYRIDESRFLPLAVAGAGAAAVK
jgi:PPIC-type PPIASE domain